MKTYILGICLCAFSYLSAQSCNLSLQGKIIDFHDNTSLQNATIAFMNTNLKAVTDSSGSFRINNLCPSTYNVIVNHPECEPFEIELNLEKDEFVTWYLEHHIIALENIETIGRQKRANNTQPEHHIHKDEIEKYSGETIGSVLKDQSGISALETGNSIVKPMVHGMHSSRVIMMNRGVRQEDMEWGVEHAPNMDINAFDDIRIVKGASALRYGGDAIGGIILMETARLPKKDTLYGKVAITGFSNGRGGNTNVDILKGFNADLGMQLQASYKKLGDRKAPDYYLTNSGNEQKAFSTHIKYGDFQQNISLDYSFYETALGILKASHLGNLKDLADAINSETPFTAEDFSYDIEKPYQKVQHHLAKIHGEKRFRNLGKLEAQYAFQFNNRKEFDVRNGEVTNIPSMDVELTTHAVETNLTIDKFSELTLNTGLDYAYQDNYSNPATQVKRLIPDYKKHKAGLYASAEFAPNNRWLFSTGVRYDFMRIDTKKYYYKRYWDEMQYDDDYQNNIIGEFGNQWLTDFSLDYNNVSATLGMSYRKSNDTEFSLNYAYANRAPNPAELFSEGLHHSAVSIELGDVRLKSEHAHKISINYNQKLKFLESTELNILGYFNQINNYIYQVPSGAKYTIRGAFPVWKFKQIDAQILGADIDLKVELNKSLSYNTQFSWTYGQDKTNNLSLLLMPPLNWSQSFTYAWENDYKPYLTLNTQWVGKQNRVPDYNFDLSVLENGEFVDKTVDISSVPDAYFLLGLESGIIVPINKNPLTIQAKVHNLMNVAYRNYLNRFRYYADDMGRQIQIQFIYKF